MKIFWKINIYSSLLSSASLSIFVGLKKNTKNKIYKISIITEAIPLIL